MNAPRVTRVTAAAVRPDLAPDKLLVPQLVRPEFVVSHDNDAAQERTNGQPPSLTGRKA
jgi:hypothetical protein